MKQKNDFIFHFPTLWLHGRGTVSEIGRKIRELFDNIERVLVVTDKDIKEAGYINLLEESLTSVDLEYKIFDKVQPEPLSKVVDDNAGLFEEQSFDLVIAVGGGSSIDVGKGLRILACCGKSIKDYRGIGKVPKMLSIPLVAVPTTAGTGSEVSPGAVFTDEKKGSKFGVVDWKITASLAVTDPLLTRTMPPLLTAVTGIDALVHAIESYVSLDAQPVTDALNGESIKLISEALEKAVIDGEDLDSREKMQIASTLAGVGMGNTQLGLVHAIAEPLAVSCNVSHGIATGLMLPYVMKFNFDSNPEKYLKIARIMSKGERLSTQKGESKRVIRVIRQLMKEIDLPLRLRDIGVDKKSFQEIAKNAFLGLQVRRNPRQVVNEQQIVALLEEAF